MRYADPNTENAKINFKEKYDNFIGGKWVAPSKVSILTIFHL